MAAAGCALVDKISHLLSSPCRSSHLLAPLLLCRPKNAEEDVCDNAHPFIIAALASPVGARCLLVGSSTLPLLCRPEDAEEDV